jgi:hypothetical protein
VWRETEWRGTSEGFDATVKLAGRGDESVTVRIEKRGLADFLGRRR